MQYLSAVDKYAQKQLQKYSSKHDIIIIDWHLANSEVVNRTGEKLK